MQTFRSKFEQSIRVPRIVRVVLGVILLFGGAFFGVVAAVLLSAIHVKHSQPSVTTVVGVAALLVTMLVLALGSLLIGARLVLMRTYYGRLLGPVGLRITAYCAASLSIATVGAGLFMDQPYWIASGAMAFILALGAYRAAGSLARRGTP